MSLTNDEVKEFLFDHINSAHTQKLLVERRFDEVIRKVTGDCLGVMTQSNKDAPVILATVLLHYLLTAAQIPSQRRVELDGRQVDIVIPDIKTLQSDPQKTLVLCICTAEDAKRRLSEACAIQPHKENIWAVLPHGIHMQNKTFLVGGSFEGIIFEIAKFANVRGDRLKILRI